MGASNTLGLGQANPHDGAARKSGADEGPLVTWMTDAGPCHLRVARLFSATLSVVDRGPIRVEFKGS